MAFLIDAYRCVLKDAGECVYQRKHRALSIECRALLIDHMALLTEYTALYTYIQVSAGR